MLAAGEALPAGRTGSEQILRHGVVGLDSFYCRALGLWLPLRKGFREPRMFYCYNIQEKKKSVL